MVECELSRGYYRKRSEAVLIDTWWNVNKRVAFLDLNGLGFNRYMVECE